MREAKVDLVYEVGVGIINTIQDNSVDAPENYTVKFLVRDKSGAIIAETIGGNWLVEY